jgi:hypothetical protein
LAQLAWPLMTLQLVYLRLPWQRVFWPQAFLRRVVLRLPSGDLQCGEFGARCSRAMRSRKHDRMSEETQGLRRQNAVLSGLTVLYHRFLVCD